MTRLFSFMLAATLSVASFDLLAQSGSDLFQKALSKERVDGQLAEAIALYERVVEEFASDRALAAKALLQIGRCYERLGKGDAQKVYARLLREYVDQRDVANEARARLDALSRSVRPAETTLSMRRIWAGADVTVDGRISPDGRLLTKVDWSSGDLAVRDLVSGKTTRLTTKGSWAESGAFAAASIFSPDGQQVAFGWYATGTRIELRVVGADGAGLRTLYRNEEATWLDPHAWSPDGRVIAAVVSRTDLTNQLILISPVDGSVRALKTFDWRVPKHVRFSADGRYLVYDFPARDDAVQRDVYLIAIDGSRETRIIASAGNDTVLGWVPQAGALLFASDRTGTNDAWVIDIDSRGVAGAERVVKRNVGAVIPLGFTRQRQLHYGLITGMEDVYVATLDVPGGRVVSPPARLTERSLGSNADPFWSPDGREIGYISGRIRAPGGAVLSAGSEQIVIRSLDTGSEREIFPRVSFFQPRWSPDGRTILMRGYDLKRRDSLFSLDVRSGELTTLRGEDGGTMYDPDWFPDSRHLVYRLLTDAGTRIVVRDLLTGSERELHRGLAKYLRVSPNGDHVAFTEPAGNGVALKIMPATGGESRLLFVNSSPGRTCVSWTPDGRYLVFNRDRDLMSVPADGGEARLLGVSMPGITDLTIHPDGRRIAITSGRPEAEVWVMENFLPATLTASVSGDAKRPR